MTGNNEAARYITEQVTGDGIDLKGDLKIKPTIGFVVKYSGDNMVAWRGPSWWAHAVQGRRLGGLRLQASNMAKRYQSHLDSTGKRFEIEEKEKREAEKAKRDHARKVDAAKRSAALVLYDALAGLLNHSRPNGWLYVHENDSLVKAAMAAMEKADG